MKHILPLVILLGISLVLISCSSEEITNPPETTTLADVGTINDLDKGRGRNNNPGVIPPHARPGGKSYAEWSAAWWQWLWSAPVPVNPGLDETGENVDYGQSGSVWFIAPNYGGVSERTATIPPGKKLFIDVAAFFTSPILDGTDDEEELRAILDFWTDQIEGIVLEGDGVPLQDVENKKLKTQ